MTKHIILLFFLLVAKDSVSLGDLLELILRIELLIPIGVVLESEFTERPLDVVLRCLSFNAQNLVVVPLACQTSHLEYILALNRSTG